MPARRPEYRANRSHEEFVRSLAAAGVPIKRAFVEAIVEAAAELLDLQEVGVGEADAARAAPHRKTTGLLDADGKTVTISDTQ